MLCELFEHIMEAVSSAYYATGERGLICLMVALRVGCGTQLRTTIPVILYSSSQLKLWGLFHYFDEFHVDVGWYVWILDTASVASVGHSFTCLHLDFLCTVGCLELCECTLQLCMFSTNDKPKASVLAHTG